MRMHAIAHRWFREGENWAYSRDMDVGFFLEKVKKYVARRIHDGSEFSDDALDDVPGGARLRFNRYDDPNCRDPLASRGGKTPFAYVVLLCVPAPPKDDPYMEGHAKALREAALKVSKPGPQEGWTRVWGEETRKSSRKNAPSGVPSDRNVRRVLLKIMVILVVILLLGGALIAMMFTPSRRVNENPPDAPTGAVSEAADDEIMPEPSRPPPPEEIWKAISHAAMEKASGLTENDIQAKPWAIYAAYYDYAFDLCEREYPHMKGSAAIAEAREIIGKFRNKSDYTRENELKLWKGLVEANKSAFKEQDTPDYLKMLLELSAGPK